MTTSSPSTSEASTGRIATFTTLSGPNLDHLAHVLRTDRGAAHIQVPKSLYTVFLSLPILRTTVWRFGAARLLHRWMRRTEGLDPADDFPGPGLAQHAAAGVPLYRTNISARSLTPPIRLVHVPVHQVVSTEDRYLDDFTRREIRAGHWSLRSHPDLVAGAIVALLDDRDPVRN